MIAINMAGLQSVIDILVTLYVVSMHKNHA